MKLIQIFTIVVLVHVALITVLFVQPGCQTSRPAPSAPAQAPTAATERPADPWATQTQPSSGLDSAFNAGLDTGSGASTGAVRAAPTRPSRPTLSPDSGFNDTGVLQPLVDEPEPPMAQVSYTVKGGDSLSKIARSQGVSLQELLDANGLTRTSVIYPGQELIIPVAAGTVGGASFTADTGAGVSGGTTYTVVGGDSLSRIASRHSTTVAALKAANNLTSDTIRVGQVLKVPGGTGVESTAIAPTVAPTASTAAVAGSGTYTVRPGDTLGAISKRFGTTVGELAAVNGIADPRKLRVGQVLKLPAGASGAGAATGAATVTAPAPRGASTTTTPAVPVVTPGTVQVRPESSQPEIIGGMPNEPGISDLEELEDDDIPYVEVEQIGGGGN